MLSSRSSPFRDHSQGQLVFLRKLLREKLQGMAQYAPHDYLHFVRICSLWNVALLRKKRQRSTIRRAPAIIRRFVSLN